MKKEILPLFLAASLAGTTAYAHEPTTVELEELCTQKIKSAPARYVGGPVCGTDAMINVDNVSAYTCLTQAQAGILGMDTSLGLSVTDYVSPRDPDISRKGCPGKTGTPNNQSCYNLNDAVITGSTPEITQVFLDIDIDITVDNTTIIDNKDYGEEVDLDAFEEEQKKEEEEKKKKPKKPKRLIPQGVSNPYDSLRIGVFDQFQFPLGFLEDTNFLGAYLEFSTPLIKSDSRKGRFTFRLGQSWVHHSTQDTDYTSESVQGETSVVNTPVGNPDYNRVLRHTQTPHLTTRHTLKIPDNLTATSIDVLFETPESAGPVGIAGRFGFGSDFSYGSVITSSYEERTHFVNQSSLFRDDILEEELDEGSRDITTIDTQTFAYGAVTPHLRGGARFELGNVLGISLEAQVGVMIGNAFDGAANDTNTPSFAHYGGFSISVDGNIYLTGRRGR